MKRKWYLLQPDGASDEPQDALHGKTPLEAARLDTLHELVRIGRLYRLRTIPSGFPPGSDIGNLVLLGYDPRQYYRGRAALEAAALGIQLKPREVVFRMNLITLSRNSPLILEDFSAGHISSDEAKSFITVISSLLPSGFRLYAGVSYRHLLVTEGEFAVETVPPHDIQGKPIGEYLPKGQGGEILTEIMETVRLHLARHPLNEERERMGKPPVNGIWLWGKGEAMELPAFSSVYPGYSGSVITAVDLVRGIARLAGLTVIEVPGATGYIDTNYDGKAQAALASPTDFVFLHLEAPDECSHIGDLEKKIYALEQFDRRIVRPIWEEAQRSGAGIIVAPDHPTYVRTRTHALGDVPCLVVLGNDPTPKSTNTLLGYCERVAEGKPLLDGLKLLHSAFFEDFTLGYT